MPAFVLLPPTSLAVEQPEMVAALLANADGLTSHLDLYVTLRELLAMGSKESLVEPTRGGASSSSYHLIINSGLPGKSLLHPIERRGCATAGVPPQVFPHSFDHPCPFYTDTWLLTVLLLHGGKGESGEQQYGGGGQVSQPSLPSISLASCLPSISLASCVPSISSSNTFPGLS